MRLKVINSTDDHFRGQYLRGSTLEEAIMPLVKAVGDFDVIKIINDRVILQNSNYLIIAEIIK